jgi:hypothetical protein
MRVETCRLSQILNLFMIHGRCALLVALYEYIKITGWHVLQNYFLYTSNTKTHSYHKHDAFGDWPALCVRDMTTVTNLENGKCYASVTSITVYSRIKLQVKINLLPCYNNPVNHLMQDSDIPCSVIYHRHKAFLRALNQQQRKTHAYWIAVLLCSLSRDLSCKKL